MNGTWIGILGVVAGCCTAGSFVPQVLKAWREGDTGAISKRMYVLTLAAFVLWLVYGLLVRSWPLILFNVINLVLGGAILALKMRDEKSSEPA